MRDVAQAVDELGYHHLLIYDHVLGADPNRPGGWDGPYTTASLFHEVFITLGYTAGITRSIELMSSVLVLPQRQTALVAKQAAEIDVLSGGRIRLGVGVGWNTVEYEALGDPFHNRGARLEEQVALLRRLWTAPVFSFNGRWHTVTQAGLNPLPSRLIPVWIGGGADVVMRRAARLADGWIPMAIELRNNDEPLERQVTARRRMLETIRGYVREAGRDPAAFGIQAQLDYRAGDAETWNRHVQLWRDLGASHVAMRTVGGGFTSTDQHIEALRRFKAAID